MIPYLLQIIRKKSLDKIWAAFRSESHCTSNSRSPCQCSAFKVIFNFYICIYIYICKEVSTLPIPTHSPNWAQSEQTRGKRFCFVFHWLQLALTYTNPPNTLQIPFFSFEVSTLAYGKMLLKNAIHTCQGTHKAKRMLTLFMNMWFVFIHMLVNKKKNNCFQEIKTHLN